MTERQRQGGILLFDRTYGYDTLNRLTSAQLKDSQGWDPWKYVDFSFVGTSYVYDRLGNRLSSNNRAEGLLTYESDKANRLTQVTEDSTPWTPQFDLAGNMTHAPMMAVEGHPEYDYAYDHLNRLTSVTRSSDTTEVATFTYDALGRRIQHVNAVLGTTTRVLSRP